MVKVIACSATPMTSQHFFPGGRLSWRVFFFSFPLNASHPPSFRSSILSRKVPPLYFPSQVAATPTVIPVVSEGKEEEPGLICPGCGVFMQNSNPNLLGFYQISTRSAQLNGDIEDSSNDISFDQDGLLEDLVEECDESFSKSDQQSEIDDKLDDDDSGIDLELNWNLMEGRDSNWMNNGFAPAGVGYGNITSETLEIEKKKKMILKAEKKKMLKDSMKNEYDNSITVCSRCHSLRNYGLIKNQKAENLIPDFDFDRLISTKLIKSSSTSPVVVIVVDCVDFDGSFPKRAAKSLFKSLEASMNSSKMTKLPKLVLVATKVDLLPQKISPARLDMWVRRRAKAAGAPKLTDVYLVSARKDLNVRNLLSFIKELAGPRGNIWVIGAQNAGKSTLINAFAKNERVKATRLTETSLPGTTLGILRITGVLPAKARLYDTPGLLHPYIMTTRLNREEQNMAEIRKELKSRTYRIKAGQTVHVGGLMRIDLIQCSAETIYVTVWASPHVSLHMGRIDNAGELRSKHFGIRMQPPIGQDRVAEMGEWKAREFEVSGSTWDVNSVDLAASGLGWFSLGLKGKASVIIWTFEGIEVTEREPMLLDRAIFLERPGFLLPKAISKSIGSQEKMEARARKEKVEEENAFSEQNLKEDF